MADQAKPLKGVVLCCTSLTNDVRVGAPAARQDSNLSATADDLLLKAQIADAASEMGATHNLDLTSDVTHLLVANITTPKYRYWAKERFPARVLSPQFIDAVKKEWMEGGDAVNVEELERKYTLPPFYGLHICVTGVEDMSVRKEMENTFVANGAVYSGDLTKAVTHLIAMRPEGAKYTHAKQWNIPVVGTKWYEDSLKRGMALDEQLYMVEMPREQQGIGAWKTAPRAPINATIGKRGRDMAEEEVGRRKLRKVASARLDEHSQDMLRQISQVEVQVDTTEVDIWNDDSQSGQPQTETRLQRRPESRLETPLDPASLQQPQKLFSGHCILIHGFDDVKKEKLQHHLTENGAVLVENAEGLRSADADPSFANRCLLVPHSKPIVTPELPAGTVIVTEWWVERCIHYQQQMNPESDILSTPLSNSFVDGFAGLNVSSTGFSGLELRQTSEVVKLMGAHYQEKLDSSTTILVCANDNIRREKSTYASFRKIPAVSARWLWDSLSARKAAPVDEYRIILPAFDPDGSLAGGSFSSPAPTGNTHLPLRGPSKAPERVDDPSFPKRLSNTRKRHATPSLVFKPSRPTPAEPRKPTMGPFVHEDDSDDDGPATGTDQPALSATRPDSRGVEQPLREIAPNVSPRRSGSDARTSRPETESAGTGLFKTPAVSKDQGPVSPTTSSPRSPEEVPVEDRNAAKEVPQQQRHEAELTDILGKMGSRPLQPGLSTAPQKRKNRPLGRNLSSISNKSGSASASPALPSEVPESTTLADGFSTSREAAELPPGTQLGYENPDAEAHRKRMSKKLGLTTMEEEGRPQAASIGTVKDSERAAMASVAGRTKGRTTRNRH